MTRPAPRCPPTTRTPFFTDLLAQLDRRSLSPHDFIRRITEDRQLQALLDRLWQQAEQQCNLALALWCALHYPLSIRSSIYDYLARHLMRSTSA